MSLLIVIPFNASQAESAEKLCDFIYFISGKQQQGHCLLVASSDVHDEMKLKVKLAAEVAFENVNLAVTRANPFSETVKLVSQNYKSPWLWLEPDCVPLKVGWIGALQEAYDNQPKKYMGAYYKNEAGQLFMARPAVYPAYAESDHGDISDVTTYSTKCRLIQIGKYEGVTKLRPDAVLFCSDKTNALINDLKMLKGQ
jgi:hypothetical protein